MVPVGLGTEFVSVKQVGLKPKPSAKSNSAKAENVEFELFVATKVCEQTHGVNIGYLLMAIQFHYRALTKDYVWL